MVLIYSPHLSSRLEYIAKHLFKNILGVDFFLSSEKNVFLDYSGICINYSNEKLNRGVQILPYGLLEKTGVDTDIELKESQWGDLFCFFANDNSVIPFDIFSASFYLLTSYEEYGCKGLDQHSRFSHEKSLAYKKGFLELPLIDHWTYKLKDILVDAFGGYDPFNLRTYRFVSTFDIDYPYRYLNKGCIKNSVTLCRALLNRNVEVFSECLKVILHKTEDPYFRVVSWLNDFHEGHAKDYYLFALISKYGKFGRKTIYSQRKYFDLIQSFKKAKIGLHTSYDGFLNKKRTLKEKIILEKKIGKEVRINRQHYLRLQLPETYCTLSELNFKEDFSLAYAKVPGFRSGTAIPYLFYDLSTDTCTKLKIRPTIVMDTCLMTHLELGIHDALTKIKKLADECKKSGGDFVMLWHNNNLAGCQEKNPWINVFIQSFEYAHSLENGNFEPEKK